MLIVEDDLPKHLKQSMFAHAGQYPVVCRYSSEPGDPGLDVQLKSGDSAGTHSLPLLRTAFHNLVASL